MQEYIKFLKGNIHYGYRFWTNRKSVIHWLRLKGPLLNGGIQIVIEFTKHCRVTNELPAAYSVNYFFVVAYLWVEQFHLSWTPMILWEPQLYKHDLILRQDL